MRISSLNRILVPLSVAAMPLIAVAEQQQPVELPQESVDAVVEQLNTLPPPAASPRPYDPLQQTRPLFDYRPPDRGAPLQRVGGGTRSISPLSVLAPRHVALTTRTQPRLYWFVSPGFHNKLRFRLSEAGVKPPLLEIQLPPQPDGGMRHLDLKMHDVHLEPGKLYDWGVILEPLPHQRVRPLVSRGRIALDDAYPIPADAPLDQKPYIAAQQGYWYDALDWISRLIDAGEDNATLSHQRADLLEQGNLLSAASYERETLGSRQ